MAPGKLTNKQEQVFGLLKMDKDPKTIAAELGVSKAAIYSHIRAIKEAGHAIPAKYANVGVGGRGASTRARAASKSGNGRRKGAAPRKSVSEEVLDTLKPSTPTKGVGSLLAAPTAPGLDVEGVFSHLLQQIAEDQRNIEARRGQIKAEVEALTERVQALTDEDSDLEVALARLAGTAKSIDAAPSANGSGAAESVDLTGAKA